MKADIQSQIEMINENLLLPEFCDTSSEELEKSIRRRTFLNHVLKAPTSEIDETVLNFVYQR